MNILRLSTVSLTLAIAVFALGYVNSASAAKKGEDCTKENPHPSCSKGDPGGSGGEPGTFTVTVFFEPLPVTNQEATEFAGSETNVVGSSDFAEGHFRAGLGEFDMFLDLVYLDTGEQLPDCKTTFGLEGVEDGLFAISTSRHEEDGQLTSAFAGFWNFTAGIPEVSYSVSFDNGLLDLDQLGNWLPAPGTGNTLRGDKINLAVAKGPTKKGPCNGIITQDWKIDVFNDATL